MNDPSQAAGQTAPETPSTPAQTPVSTPELSKDNPTPSTTPQKKGRGGPRINSGRPKGIHTPLRTKKLYNVEELADLATVALIEGKGQGLQNHPKLGPVREEDRVHMARITGQSVEVFNEHMANRLRTIADKAAIRIEQKLDSDSFKSGELGFILSVAHDKRLSLDGSRALNNASVNIQVNNYGTQPKDQLLTELDGMTNVTPKQVNSDVISRDNASNSHPVSMDSARRSEKAS